MSEEEPVRPALRIVRGDPSPEETAALVAVLAAAGGGEAPADPAPPSAWARRADLVRKPVHPGPGGWRSSAFP